MPEHLHLDLEKTIGYSFKDLSQLELALTHPSLSRKAGKKSELKNNERLEFLGDRVLGLVIAELVYKEFPNDAEGSLAKRHAALVRKEALAVVAHKINLGSHIQMIEAEERSGGRENDAILANACEALIAAIYLDTDIKAAEAFIHKFWLSMMHEDITPPQDAKTALQEWVQSKALGLPKYNLISRTGPDHAPVFEIEVSVKGHAPLQGSGASKRKAEQAAAENFLSYLKGLK